MFRETINISINNTGPSADTWTAFGYNAGTTTPSSGVTTTVDSNPVSMAYANRESQQNPYVTKRIKVKVSNLNDFDNSIVIRGTRGSSVDQVEIALADYAGPNRGIGNLIEIPLPGFVIDGSISVGGTIAGNANMNVVIEYEHLFDQKKKTSNLTYVEEVAGKIQNGQLTVKGFPH